MFPLPFHLGHYQTFSLEVFASAIQERDADRIIAAYAPDAIVHLLDPDHPPQSPRTLTGRAALASWIRDICSPDVTHRVVDLVDAGDMVSFTDQARYRPGTQEWSISVAAIDDGLIVRQRMLSVWDGWD